MFPVIIAFSGFFYFDYTTESLNGIIKLPLQFVG